MISSKLYAWFFLLSCLLLFMLVMCVFRESSQEWRTFQPSFKAKAQARVREASGTAKDETRRKNLEIRSSALEARKTEIKQIVVSDLKRVDRCTTCHIGVETPDYDIAAPALAGHPEPYLYELAELPGDLFAVSRKVHELAEFGCTICHGGQGRATVKDDAHGEVAHWDAPLLKGQHAEAACGKCHFEETIIGASTFTEGRKLFLKAGCFGCHKIEKYPKDRVIAPTLKHIASKVKEEWLIRWLTNPKEYLPDTLMPNYGFHPKEAADTPDDKKQASEEDTNAVKFPQHPSDELSNLVAYLMTLKEKKGYPSIDLNRLSDPSSIEKGKALVGESACSTCHEIAGETPAERVGPSLTRIAEKANLAWIADWLRKPKAHLPSTKMPRYHFKNDEVISVVAFLKSLSSKTETSAERVKGDPQEGRKVIKKYGCFGCHEIPGFKGLEGIGPDISHVGSRAGYELDFGKLEYIDDLLTREKRRLEVAKRKLEKIENDLETIERSIGNTEDPLAIQKLGNQRQQKLAEKSAAEKRDQELKRKLDKHTKLKESVAKDLVRQRRLKDWLLIKLTEPRAFDPDQLKMPTFDFTSEEANNLVTFLLSLTKDVIPQRLLRRPPPRIAYEPTGRFGQLESELNCLTCHKIYGRGGAIGPDLTAEGSRAKRDWLSNFFKNPKRIRPTLRGRMPKFRLSDSDVGALVEYAKLVLVDNGIRSPSDIEPDISFGRDLYGQREGFACAACHKIKGEGGEVGPDLTAAGTRLERPWVVSWLRNPQRLIPDTIMPNFGLEDEDAVHLSAYVLSKP